MAIKVIDLFAGPGGLGEGFSSVLNEGRERDFEIKLSIEKDEFAHRTLTLRSFVRQFPYKNPPKEYYQLLRGNISIDDLFGLYPYEASVATNEAQRIELGKTSNDCLDKKIALALDGDPNWVLIGGPPCQAYSVVGRARRGGINPNDERVYLYREYYRILAKHNPPVFIMENVKGLLSSKIDDSSIFEQILADLRNPVEAYHALHGAKELPQHPGYRIFSLVSQPTYDLFQEPKFDVKDFTIKAEEYGIPQSRHRVILLGVRKDLKIREVPVLAKSAAISVKQVLSGLPALRSQISRGLDDEIQWKMLLQNAPKQSFYKEISDKRIKAYIKSVSRNIRLKRSGSGGPFIAGEINIDYNPEWYLCDKLGGVTNHESRGHMKEDLFRYLFAGCFARIHKRSPLLFEFPASLLPKHQNVKEGVINKKFNDRFRVQVSGHPAKTITSHISKDGHYYIHPDPSQCRSLTVREAARLQTFPDDYFFCGPRTEQFHQVGNAVPPLLANKIAQVVSKLLTGFVSNPRRAKFQALEV